MPIVRLTLEIEIGHAQSLKDRRQVVRSLKDTLRRSFNVSVVELDEAIVWNRATLGIVSISRSVGYLKGQIQLVEQAAGRISSSYGAEVVDSFAEFIESELDPDES